jgi:hypothetical protein
MKDIKMVAKLGDQVMPVGTCNQAQARILVRDDLAAWQDGTIMLFIRKAHLALLDSNPGTWRCKKDDDNVSEAEIDRRKAWFIQFMPIATIALTHKQGSERDEIHAVAVQMAGGMTTRHSEYEGVAPSVIAIAPQKAIVKHVGPVGGTTDVESIPKDGLRNNAGENVGVSADDDAFLDEIFQFDTENVARSYVPDAEVKDLSLLWESSPDVSRVFDTKKTPTYSFEDGVFQKTTHDVEIVESDDYDVELPESDVDSASTDLRMAAERKALRRGLIQKDSEEDQEAIKIHAEFILTKRNPVVIALALASALEAKKERRAVADAAKNATAADEPKPKVRKAKKPKS